MRQKFFNFGNLPRELQKATDTDQGVVGTRI